MPIGPYQDFDDCVSQNTDKEDPNAYCAAIQRQVESEKDGWQDSQPWYNDRIIETIISAEVVDKQNELIPTEEIEAVLPHFVKYNGLYTWQHTDLPIGRAIGWRMKDGKPEIRVGIHDGEETNDPRMDDVWESIKELGLDGSSSIKGAAAQSDINCKEGKCYTEVSGLCLNAVGYVEDHPANPEAKVTAINQQAKAWNYASADGVDITGLNITFAKSEPTTWPTMKMSLIAKQDDGTEATVVPAESVEASDVPKMTFLHKLDLAIDSCSWCQREIERMVRHEDIDEGLAKEMVRLRLYKMFTVIAGTTQPDKSEDDTMSEEEKTTEKQDEMPAEEPAEETPSEGEFATKESVEALAVHQDQTDEELKQLAMAVTELREGTQDAAEEAAVQAEEVVQEIDEKPDAVEVIAGLQDGSLMAVMVDGQLVLQKATPKKSVAPGAGEQDISKGEPAYDPEELKNLTPDTVDGFMDANFGGRRRKP
jgi:hypothetical protein